MNMFIEGRLNLTFFFEELERKKKETNMKD